MSGLYLVCFSLHRKRQLDRCEQEAHFSRPYPKTPEPASQGAFPRGVRRALRTDTHRVGVFPLAEQLWDLPACFFCP